LQAKLNSGGLKRLGLKQVPVGIGTVGQPSSLKHDEKLHVEQDYEFAAATSIMKNAEGKLLSGHDLLKKVVDKAKRENFKLTILALSSLMDLGEYVRGSPAKQDKTSPEETEAYSEEGQELAKYLKKVIFQGGYQISPKGILTPDLGAANNRWSEDDSKTVHRFLQINKIPTTAYTKDGAYATGDKMETGLLTKLEKTGVDLAKYLHAVQIPQDKLFYKRSCFPDHQSSKRFFYIMDASFVLFKRTFWFNTHTDPPYNPELPSDKWFDPPYSYPKPQEPYDEALKPGELDELESYLTRLTLYDVLAALGTIGEEQMLRLGLLKKNFNDGQDALHKFVGIHAPPKTEEVIGKDGNPKLNKYNKPMKKEIEPAVLNLDANSMAKYAGALMAGAIYRVPGAVTPLISPAADH